MSIENKMTVAIKYCSILFLYSLFTSIIVNAEQLNFSKKAQDDAYLFSYQWTDYKKQLQQMHFMLSKDALFNRFRTLKTYKPKFAKKSILRRMRKKLQQEPIQNVQIFFNEREGKTFIDIRGADQQVINNAYDKIQQLEENCTQEYLNENYFQSYVDYNKNVGIKPDHVKIANLSVADLKVLKPIILEKVSILNIRQVSDFVLSFIQNIPYSPLESRLTSSGAGFNPPLKLLWENQGDCDSKMTLTAGILRALMPRIEIILIYIDEHAFIGLAIPSEGNDVSIEYEGIHYVLAEPTGPALLPWGTLAPASELAIDQGRYRVEKLMVEDNEDDTDTLVTNQKVTK